MINVLLVAACMLSGMSNEKVFMASISPEPPPVSRTPPGKQKTLEDLNNEIESLANLRDYYSAKVARYRDRATRYEFQGDNLQESKKLSKEADKLEEVVKQIDAEIAILEKKRSAMLSKS